MDISIVQNFWYEKEQIYESDTLHLEPGKSVLVGCNGSGKTTLLSQIETHCERNNIKFLKYSNLTDGGNNYKGELMHFHGDVKDMMEYITSSEGECMKIAFGHFATTIGRFISQNMIESELFLLLDAMDSGWSIDNIVEFGELLKLIQQDYRGNIYIIIAANSYEMTKLGRCIDAQTLNEVEFKDYENYKDFILTTRDKKLKRYN